MQHLRFRHRRSPAAATTEIQLPKSMDELTLAIAWRTSRLGRLGTIVPSSATAFFICFINSPIWTMPSPSVSSLEHTALQRSSGMSTPKRERILRSCSGDNSPAVLKPHERRV